MLMKQTKSFSSFLTLLPRYTVIDNAITLLYYKTAYGQVIALYNTVAII